MRRDSGSCCRAAGFVLIGALASGCSCHHEDAWSRQWPARVPAGGTVTVHGQPVEAATVVFVTERAGRFYNAMGQTDAAGRFTLQTFRPRDGAVPGTHRVRIEKLTFTEKPANLPPEASFTPVETSHLPKKYRSPETSGLTVEVREQGPNEFVFDLEAAAAQTPRLPF
jgi:hypothetical protein